MLDPLVSVVVTTFNQAPFIAEAIRSVFEQTYEPFEVIVVNDGSTDDTESKIAPFKDRIRYVYQQNQGVAGSRNTGIRHAHGQFVAFLDGDDLWEREKLAIQVAAAKRRPEIGLIAVNGVQFCESGLLSDSLLRCPVEGFLEHVGSELYCGWSYAQLLQGNFINTISQAMMPHRVLQEIGDSDGSFKLASDYDLYLRIARKFKIMIIKTPFMKWRYHSANASGSGEYRDFNWRKESIEVLQKHLHEAPADCEPVIRAVLQNTLSLTASEAYYFGRKQDRIWARRYLARLLAGNPTSLPLASSFAGLCLPRWLADLAGRRFKQLLK